jgi:tRNA 2-thiouridine synthesizing protein A
MPKAQALKDRQEMQIAMKLDAKGLNCPLPILKTKVVLNKMHPGEILFVEATDPHAEIDFEAYCARSRHELIQVKQNGDVYEFYIRRAENPEHT